MELVQADWYRKLLEGIKQHTYAKIVEAKHYVGKRILEDFEKFGKPEYGSRRLENIAKDTGTNRRELELCVQFARKYPTLRDDITQSSWYDITHKLLPKPREERVVEPLALPAGKYNIIYADPAWKYYEGGYKNQSQHYDTMEVGEIAALPIDEIAADDCLLFLWVTWPIIDDAFGILQAWEFEYSTCAFIWVKSKKDGTGFFFGNGNWTRANTEPCILARKGSVARDDASVSQIIYEPIQEHSRKPAIVRDKIVQLVGDLPRVELFARERVDGWDAWGREVDATK